MNMPNLIKSGTTISAGTLRRNNFILGVDTTVDYGPTSSTGFWNGISPTTNGYVVYAQKDTSGPSIRTATDDTGLRTIATQYGATNVYNQYETLSYFNSQTNMMVTNIDYPNLVTSGLTLNLDAGFIPSYPRTGTTWYDISGSLNDATLTNGPSYTNQSIYFEGINDYASIASDLLTNVYTVSVWFTPQIMGTTNAIWSEGNTGVKILSLGSRLDYNYSSGGTLSGSCSLSSTSWYNVVVTSDGTNVTMYLNNAQLATAVASAENPTGNFQIATDSSNNFFNGSIGQIGIYNRVLTSTELTQNYNALQSRFTGGTTPFYYFGGQYSLADAFPQPYLSLLNNDASVSTSFDIRGGFNNDVRALAVDTSGKIFVGGAFSTFTGSSQLNLIKLNPDGSKDATFDIGTGFNGVVYDVKIDGSGNVFAAGAFSTYKGAIAQRVVKLDSTGTKDANFNPSIPLGTVYSIAIDSDGKVYITGSFATVQGQTRYGLARLNTDGTLDTTFAVGLALGVGTTGLKVIIDSSRKVLVGGTFITYAGSSSSKLVRINSDGTKDTTFNIGTGFNVDVYEIDIDSTGKILVGGAFTTFTGSTENRIIRLNSNGSKDSTFNVGTGFNLPVWNITIDTSGKILVVGAFTTFTGSTQNRIIRLNSDGSKDTTFDVGSGYNNTTYVSTLISGNKYLTGGSAFYYKGITDNGLARYNSDYVISDQNFNIGTGFTSGVNTLKQNNNGKILAAGSFSQYSGLSRNGIIRLNPDGSNDSSFTIGTGFTGGATVVTIKLDSNNKILAGGNFTSYSGISANRIIRLNDDGSNDGTFTIGTGFTASSTVFTIDTDSNGKILVGGTFTSYSGLSRNRIVRLNTDGSEDSTFGIGTGFNNTVSVILVDSNQKVLVGGVFTSYSGISANRLIRLNTDGTKDTSFDIGTGFNGSVASLKIDSNGKILVGGAFTTFTGSTQNFLIRLNSNGSKDTSFDVGTGLSTNVVNSINIDLNNRIQVGGGFTSYNGYSALYTVILNTDGSFYRGFGFNYTINSII